MNLVTLT